MNYIKNAFKKDTILLVYKCGSHAFGTSSENSDEDFVVVLKNFNGLTHYEAGRKEYFIFGLDTWKEKQEFSDDYDDYFEILALPETIVYQYESIKELIEKYKIDFKVNYKTWLKKVVRYFEDYIKLNTINKQMYHVIRIKHIVENYKKHGSFSLDLSKEVLDWIKKFKASESRKQYKNEIIEALIYLKNEGGNLEWTEQTLH